jgi:transcriptional repressor of dcmA and dcmR
VVFERDSRAGPSRIVPVGQASEILNVHPNTLRKWSDQGMIPCYRIGHRRDRRFALDDLAGFLERYDNGGNGIPANGSGPLAG